MTLGEILTLVSSFILGGGLMTIITWKSTKKKADVEVKMDEITAIHNTIEFVYQPIIEAQNKRIQDLEKEVKSLRDQLVLERSDHQKEIDRMNKQILAITNALGLKAVQRIRDAQGRYAKVEGSDSDEL